MGSIMRLSAADGGSTTSVDAKFESKDGFADPFFVEDVPVALDKLLDFSLDFGGDLVAYAEILDKFSAVDSFVPLADIVAVGVDKKRSLPERATISTKDGKGLIYIVG